MKLKLLFLLLLITLPSNGFSTSSESYFRHYTNKQGLSNNTVYCILQDSRGFMWMGTDDGLNCFDGYKFEVYRHLDDCTESLLQDRIVSLFEDQRGLLWICTFGGTCCYDYKTNTFYPFYLNKTDEQPAHFNQICEDSDGNLWMMRWNELVCYNPTTESHKSYLFENESLRSIHLSASKELSVASSQGIFRYNAKNDSFLKNDLIRANQPSHPFTISTHKSLSKTGFLIGTEKQGLILCNLPDEQITTLIPNIQVRDIQVYNENEVWVATESGAYIYDLIHRKIAHYQKSLINDFSISDNAVYCIAQDKESGIWMGTFFGGICYLPKRFTPFRSFIAGKTHPDLSGNAIREICPDKWGSLWIGTEDNGINCYELKTGKITHFSPSNPSHPLTATNIHGLLAWEDELWIGTFNKGIEVLDIQTGKRIGWHTPQNTKHALSSDFILCFLPLSSEELLIGTANGVILYNRKDKQFSRWKPIQGLIRQLIKDASDNIWVASTSGVFQFNPNTNELQQYTTSNYPALKSNSITSIFEDQKQNIWITSTHGLTRFDPNPEKAAHFDRSAGLPSNIIYRMVEDRMNRFWISTASGLACFDPTSEQTKSFSYPDGLHETQFNFSSSYQDSTGLIYMGTINGMIAFHPMDFQEDQFTPPLYISVPTHKPTDRIELPYDSATFTLKCTALNYTSPEGIAYAYKLEGKEDAWIPMNSNREITFANLSPGDYTFMARSTNSSGIWQDNIQTLSIRIHPPFWNTLWAYLFYLLFVLTGIYFFVRYKRKRLETIHLQNQQQFETEKEKELYDAKIKFFTFITHEIRTPLTLIHAPLEKIIQANEGSEKTKRQLETIHKNTKRLLELSNQLLDFKKTEHKVFKLHFVKTEMTEWLPEHIRLYENLIEQEHKQLSVELPELPLWMDLDREAFTKIWDNLMSNAIKYSDKQIRLSIKTTGGFLQLSVINDGWLIPASEREAIFEPFYRLHETENKPGSGIGLSLASSLAEYHNGSLIYTATSTNENCFTLLLPLKQANAIAMTQAQCANSASNPIATNGEKDKPLILIVEDHPEMRAFIRQELLAIYQVQEASNGKEALELLTNQPADLIISDIRMPIMDGFELCNQLKNDLHFSHIPLILLTAQHNFQSRLEGLNQGADAYMEKPFSVDLLLAQVANLLRNRETIYNRFSQKPLEPIQTLSASPIDDQFLEKLNQYLESALQDESLSVEQLAQAMHMSTSSLYRKVKGIAGVSPVDFIKIYRLKKAIELMQKGDDRINAIAFEVGFSSAAYFSTCFQKQFGKSPSDFMKELKPTPL